LEEERFCPVFFEFPLIALKECYHAFRFAVHTGAWPVVRFGARAFGEFLVCRIAEDAGHCTVAASVPRQIPNLPKISENFLLQSD
jgi:hypothetical protein